jgi:monovalent cation/hydrogen antiporter
MQGVTFAPIVRKVGLRADAADAAVARNEARVAAVDAALVRLDQLAAEGDTDSEVLSGLRTVLNARLARYHRQPALLETAEDGEIPVSAGYVSALRARRAITDAQRDELLRWHDAGRLPDASLRLLERELDHEEHPLPPRDHR